MATILIRVEYVVRSGLSKPSGRPKKRVWNVLSPSEPIKTWYGKWIITLDRVLLFCGTKFESNHDAVNITNKRGTINMHDQKVREKTGSALNHL